METVLILTKQVIIMFILMGFGYVAYRKKWISDQGTRDMGKLLLNVAIPVVVISNFLIEKTDEKVKELLISALISLLAMLIAIVIAVLVFHKTDRIGEFSAAFSNAGFIGIPLVQATFGSGAAFYISMMIVLVNILQWTYGIYTITDDKSVMNLRKVITNPIILAVFAGIFLFFTQIKLPGIVTSVFSILSGLNTPLAMISSGIYLAQSHLLMTLKSRQVYLVSFVRLIVIPLAIVAILKYIPLGTQELKLAILTAAACPVGSNVAIFAQQYDKDYKKGVENVCVSTLLSIITLPLIIYIATKLI